MNGPKLSQLWFGRGRTEPRYSESTALGRPTSPIDKLHGSHTCSRVTANACSSFFNLPWGALTGHSWRDKDHTSGGWPLGLQKRSVLSPWLQGEAVTPENASLMDTFNLEGKLPTSKNGQITVVQTLGSTSPRVKSAT